MKIETKFNDGDKLFFIHEAKVIDTVVRGFKIERLNGVTTTIYLCNKSPEEKTVHLKVFEQLAFPTKEALLQSL